MKIAMVTGATSGIGEACARKFAHEGYSVIITGRREERLDSLKTELEKDGVSVLPLCFDVCDRAQDEIFEIAEKEGYKITPRFSPGYGDMPINLQSKIIKITNAQKLINLTATSDCVLIPTKSVTAFLGFTKENITSCTNKCLLCNFRDKCNFRR